MQLLSSSQGGQAGDSQVLVFGLGMIGSAVTRGLRRLGFQQQLTLPFDWHSEQQRIQSFEHLERVCTAPGKAGGKFSVVWSAGNNTFHSGQDETDQEWATFKQCVQHLQALERRLHPSAFEFHFVSSAGGLFEGQRVVGPSSEPAPQRPYGNLKLAQENLLLELFGPRRLALYRPSTVYGPMPQSFRKGLINNLVSNGRSNRVTVLDSHVMALRDYVFSQDVGNFIARSIWSGSTNNNDQPHRFLVSARCASIFEVVRKIERILNLNLRVRYDQQFGNHRNITFSNRVMPSAWAPASLDVGIRQFLVSR